MKCLASFVLLFLSLDTELEPTTGAPGVIFCSFLGGSWDAVADNLAASAESCFSCESSFHLVTKLKGKGTKCIRSKIFIPWPILYIIFRWPAQILTRKSVPRPCSSQFNASNHFYYRAWGSLLMLHATKQRHFDKRARECYESKNKEDYQERKVAIFKEKAERTKRTKKGQNKNKLKKPLKRNNMEFKFLFLLSCIFLATKHPNAH